MSTSPYNAVDRWTRRMVCRAPLAMLSALLFFALIQVGLHSVIEKWQPQPAYDPEYAHKMAQLRARLQQTKGVGPLILTLGSSRVATGFRPEALPEKQGPGEPHIFNMGICRWVSPATQAIVLQRLVRKGIKPDLVLFEIFPAFVLAGPEQIMKLDVNRLSWTDLEVIRPYATAPTKQRIDWLVARLVPASAQRFLLLSRYLPFWVEVNNVVAFNWATLGQWGWTCLPAYDKSYGVSNQLKAGYKIFLERSDVSETSRRVYEEMLEFCDEKGIKAGLVLMPEHAELRGCYTPASEKQLKMAVDQLGARYKVPVIDARAWLPDNAFVEGVHLTHAGAAAFTQIFDTKILQSMPIFHTETAGK